MTSKLYVVVFFFFFFFQYIVIIIRVNICMLNTIQSEIESDKRYLALN